MSRGRDQHNDQRQDQASTHDPGQWDRSEMYIPWEEARAMGYFWTNWVIK